MKAVVKCRYPLVLFFGLITAPGCSKKDPIPQVGFESKDKTQDETLESIKTIGPLKKFNAGFPSVQGRERAISEIFLSADGKRVSISNSAFEKPNKKIQVWEISGDPKKLYEYQGALLASSPDGKRMLRRGQFLGQEIVDVETGQKIGGDRVYFADHYYFRTPNILISMQSSNDWSKARKFSITQYDVSDDNLRSSFDTADDDRVRISGPINNHREIMLGVEQANRVEVWDLETKTLVRRFSLANEKFSRGQSKEYASWSGFVASPDGKLFAMQRGNDPVEIFDGITGKIVVALPMNVSPYESEFVPNQQVLIAPSNITRPDKRGTPVDFIAYDVSQKKIVAVFKGHENAGLKLDFSADGKVMVSGDEEGNVLIWDPGQLK